MTGIICVVIWRNPILLCSWVLLPYADISFCIWNGRDIGIKSSRKAYIKSCSSFCLAGLYAGWQWRESIHGKAFRDWKTGMDWYSPIFSHSVPFFNSPFSCLAPKSKSLSKYTIVSSVIVSPSFSSSVKFPFTKSAKYFNSLGVYMCQFLFLSISGFVLLVPSHISTF